MPSGNASARARMKKNRQRGCCRALAVIWMVGTAGFELATLCSQSRCATRLRYVP